MARADLAAEDIGEKNSERQADHEHGHGPRALLLWKQIANQRLCGRRTAGLSDADTNTCREQDSVAARERTPQREHTPDGSACGDESRPMPTIGHESERQPGGGIHQSEDRAEKSQ